MSFSRHSASEYFGGSNSWSASSSFRLPVKSSIGEMSARTSAMPSLTNHSKDSRWTSMRLGRSLTSRSLAKEKRSRCAGRDNGFTPLEVRGARPPGRRGIEARRRKTRQRTSIAARSSTTKHSHATARPPSGGASWRGRYGSRRGHVKDRRGTDRTLSDHHPTGRRSPPRGRRRARAGRPPGRRRRPGATSPRRWPRPPRRRPWPSRRRPSTPSRGRSWARRRRGPWPP